MENHSKNPESGPIAQENQRRGEVNNRPFDPIAGIGCSGMRLKTPLPYSDCGETEAMLPAEMTNDPAFNAAMSYDDYVRLRCRYDFEYWAARCVSVRDKLTGYDKPFVLNAPQRRVAAIFEDDRRNGRPIRMIMLKARQWGGSTLVFAYFAWIQTVVKRNWHSMICAHLKDTAATIRGMYTKLLKNYPRQWWEGDGGPALLPFERSQNTREITGRGCRMTIASVESPDAVRGTDCALAHLSEIGFWRDTPQHSAEDFIRAISGSIPMVPYSAIILESTANGVGNFFHSEWLRAKSGKSDKHAVFVPWYEIEMYQLPVDDPEALFGSLDPYERGLWERGLTLEMINWYRHKLREIGSHTAMKAEFPTTDTEAFINTGRGVFDPVHIEAMRRNCRRPEATGYLVTAATRGPRALRIDRFEPSPDGDIRVWHMPQRSGCTYRYIVTVDVGGRSAGSDYSVIAVIDRKGSPLHHLPRIAAQWRGHIDHDLLAWKAAAIARWYDNALLVVESNTLETNLDGESTYILSELHGAYPHIYRRTLRDRATGTMEQRLGFHTNRSTKAMIITSLIGMVRDGTYCEYDHEACNELAAYEQLPGGVFAARKGHHDDILMTRAIGLYVASTLSSDRDESAGSVKSMMRKW